MKVEYLNDISNGGKFKHVVSDCLIRLYDFDSNEAKLFQSTLKELINSQKDVNVDSLHFVNAINCSLTLKLSNEEGLSVLKDNEFECALTKESYQEMILSIQPFVDGESGYQWLPNGDSEIDLLFSPGGTW